MYIAGIEWRETPGRLPLVNGADVLPLAPLTILFGVNDSGKSSTLRFLAKQLDGISRRQEDMLESTTIVSFRNDLAALGAMLVDVGARGFAHSSAADWVQRTLADHPQLFGDSAATPAATLAQAPVFALEVEADLESGRPAGDGAWLVSVVASPAHAKELSEPLSDALERLRGRGRSWHAPELPDPRFLGHPLRPWYLGELGRTSLPLVPSPVRLPQGVDVAVRALESAVERARRAFRAWSASVGLELPGENQANPWVTADGMPDRFVMGFVSQLELASESLLPPFVSSTYRLDFDASSPPEDPGVTRLNARMSAVMELRAYETFAEKFRLDEIASGYQLWVELALWDLVAEADLATASLRLAACDEIVRSLERRDAPVARLEHNRRCFPDRKRTAYPSWLCAEEERAWQLDVLAVAPRDPRIAEALAETERAVRPRLMLIDEPERHLNAAIAKDAAAWLLRRAEEGCCAQTVIATHSPAFLACRGENVRHLHVRRAANRLAYTTFAPTDHEALAEVAREMQLDHGELFGLVEAIVWVEGPMDLAVVNELCGEALQHRGARVAMFGGLGNMQAILENPVSRLPNLGFVVLVDDLDVTQLDRLRASPSAVVPEDSAELRSSADLLRRARAGGRQLEFVSHGFPDIFFALPDVALAELAKRPWPGTEAVLRQAAEAGLAKSKLKGFVADRYGVKINAASCRYAAELTRRRALPEWAGRLLRAVDAIAACAAPTP
jgi:hypothetical protein